MSGDPHAANGALRASGDPHGASVNLRPDGGTIGDRAQQASDGLHAGAKLRPYGDTPGDGAVQLSFTLPVSAGARAEEAARVFVRQHGLEDVEVVHSQAMGKDFTFVVVYAHSRLSIDWDSVQAVEMDSMDFDGINAFIRERIGRQLVVVGACTGTDAHTVGIDAIMNMKGYDHHYGLERYAEIKAYNLGAQVANEDLLQRALEVNADAILVSQVVTQKDIHLTNLTGLVELLEADNLRQRFALVVGGPRISHKLALEIGFDAGFGKGTHAEDVASFLARRIVERTSTPGVAS